MDKADFIEKITVIKLLPYQKKLINTINDKTYICYPPRVGYSDYLVLREITRIVLGLDEKENI